MKHRRVFLFALPALLVLLAGCKQESSKSSEEETAYMADYESPQDHWGFVDTEGNLVIDADYDDVGPFSEGMAAVNKDGKWGFINKEGEIIIQPVYKSAWAFHEGFARVLPFDGPDLFINKEGQPLKAENWAAADDFSDGMARVKVGNVFGYIGTNGKMLVQPIYTRGWNFSHGLCVVEYNEKMGVINRMGNYVISPAYEQVKITGDGKMILARSAQGSKAFDPAGKEILHLPDAKMIESNGELIAVRDNDGMFLLSTTSPESKSKYYSNIIYLEKDRWAGKMDSGYVMLNEKGMEMSKEFYHQINKFSDAFAAYSKDDYWGYLDTAGYEMTGEVFGLAWDYREGFARAAFKEGIAFIDTNQKLAFYPPNGSIDMRDFSEGLAAVQID